MFDVTDAGVEPTLVEAAVYDTNTGPLWELFIDRVDDLKGKNSVSVVNSKWIEVPIFSVKDEYGGIRFTVPQLRQLHAEIDRVLKKEEANDERTAFDMFRVIHEPHGLGDWIPDISGPALLRVARAFMYEKLNADQMKLLKDVCSTPTGGFIYCNPKKDGEFVQKVAEAVDGE